MKGIPSAHMSLHGSAAVSPQPNPAIRGRVDLSTDCRCNQKKIQAIQAYLTAHFPGYVVRHFHAPSRFVQLGMPTQFSDRHVVSLSHGDTLPYYAVFTRGFLDGHAVGALEQRLQSWDLVGSVRAHYVAFVSEGGLSSL